MTSLNTIRTMTVRYATDGAEKMRSDADAVAGAQQRAGQAATRAADAIAAASERSARVTDTAANRQLSALKAVEREAMRVDARLRGEVAFERATKTFDRGLSQGILDRSEYERRVEQARTRYMGGNDNDPTKPRRGLDSNQRRDLMYQGGDVVASLGSGAGLGTVAFQQGPQIIQGLAAGEGGLRGGLKALGESALGLVTPFNLATAAVLGAGSAFGAAALKASSDQDALEKATQGIGRATGATAGQLELLSRSAAESGKISTSAAREIAASYTSAAQLSVPVIETLTRYTADYARLTSQEVPAAAAELTKLFTDPSRGAEELASRIGGLDDRTRQFIETQALQADKTAAQTALGDALKATIDANAAATTGWAAAWNTVSGAADKAWEAIKRAAGAATGLAPESAQSVVDRMNKRIAETNRTRAGLGMGPLGLGSDAIRERDAAMIVADTEARTARAKAAEEAANRASREAGALARGSDPLRKQYDELLSKRNTLQGALDDPLTRSKLADTDGVREAASAYQRAIDTMVDSNGKLVTSADRARQADQLRADALKATTDAEKAAVAERQKAFDLAGKVLTPLDAGGQITRAGQLSRIGSEASASKSGGSRGDAADEYDRATKSLEDRLRRQAQEAATFGMGAGAVARYRAETDLLTAAKRAERDITPTLSAEVKGYADRAAEAAARQEQLRDTMRGMDDVRAGGREVFGGITRDLTHGTSAANTFANALGRIVDRLSNMAADNLTDAIFGKRGSMDLGVLGSAGCAFGAMGGFGEVLR